MEEDRSFELVKPTLPGHRVLRRKRKPRRRLRLVPNVPGFIRFVRMLVLETPLLSLLAILVVFLLLSSGGLYLVERGVNESIDTFGEGLWWSIAAMHTMGANNPGPVTGWGQVIGSVWAILGTVLFFGAIIASVTVYVLTPRRHPHKETVSRIIYNLERVEELSLEELEALKETAGRFFQVQLEKLRRESGTLADEEHATG